MYKCDSCHDFFDIPGSYREGHGETFACCPACHGEYDPYAAYEPCAICGEMMDEGDLHTGYCAACLLDDGCDFAFNAYTYLRHTGEGDFYIGYLEGWDAPDGGYPAHYIDFAKRRFWHDPRRDMSLLREYISEEIRGFAAWYAGWRASDYDKRDYDYFMSRRDAA